MMHHPDAEEALLDIPALADRYGLAVGTVRKWRSQGYGPVSTIKPRLGLRFGARRVAYRLADVLAWEQANNITPINR